MINFIVFIVVTAAATSAVWDLTRAEVPQLPEIPPDDQIPGRSRL